MRIDKDAATQLFGAAGASGGTAVRSLTWSLIMFIV